MVDHIIIWCYNISMKLNKWTEVLVKAESKKDMTYAFNFKNQQGQMVWGSRVRPLPHATQFLQGCGQKKYKDYDFTADKTTGEYCYTFKDEAVATLFSLWFTKDSPQAMKHTKQHECPECGYNFQKGTMLLDWHRRYYKWIQKKWGVTGYTMAWISFIKGLIIGLLIAIWIN